MDRSKTLLRKWSLVSSLLVNPFAREFDSSTLFPANLDFIPIHSSRRYFPVARRFTMARVQFTQFHRGNNYTWIVLRRCFLFNLNLIARHRRVPLDFVTTCCCASGLGYITYFLPPVWLSAYKMVARTRVEN